MNKVICFFDSGIGGLPYLKWLKDRMPYCSCVYTADSANFPYGTKSSDELRNITVNAIDKIIRKIDPAIIVIACNTASVTALPKLRELYTLPFVGVVPAVKPAAINSGLKRIGLFATNKTVSDSYTDMLISQFASDCEIFRFANSDIVSFVENDLLNYADDEKQIIKMIKPAVDFFIENKVDHVVIGCTHFIFLEKYLRKMFPPEISIIDSREGVGKQAVKLINEYNVICENSGISSNFYLTSDNGRQEYYSRVAQMFSLKYAGIL